MLSYLHTDLAACRFRSAASSTRVPVLAGLPRSVCAVLLGALFGAPAHAALSDTIHPFVGVGYSYDDNLLRLPESNGGAPRSDTSRQVVAGVQLERPVGRQLLTASAKVTKVSFNRFDGLNYDGKDVAGTWVWQLGNHLDGNLGATYAQTLTPFNDFHSAERNLRTQRGGFFDGKWRLHPSWQVRAGLTRDKYEYELLARRYLNRSVDGSELGFDYLAAGGSTVGLQVHRSKANYLTGSALQNEGYTQDSLSLKVLWKLGEVTELQFLAGRAKREHASRLLADSSGTNGKMLARWAPLATLSFTAALSKEFEPYDSNLVSYSLSKGGSLGASWSPKPKVRLNVKYQYVRRDFMGPLAAVLLQGAQDSSRTTTVGANYQIRNNISLSASLFKDARSSNSIYSTNYRAQGASFNANVQF